MQNYTILYLLLLFLYFKFTSVEIRFYNIKFRQIEKEAVKKKKS